MSDQRGPIQILDLHQAGVSLLSFIPLVAEFKATKGERTEEITEADIDKMVAAFDGSKSPLPVGYFHNVLKAAATGQVLTPEQGEAAGFITEVRKVVTNGKAVLEGVIAWNAKGRAKVKEKLIRFLSIEATRGDNKKLIGAALTNHPFWDEQAPIALSADLALGMVLDAVKPNQEEVIRMDTNLIQALGLEGEATAEQATEAVQALTAEIEGLKANAEKSEADKATAEATAEAEAQKNQTLADRVVALENDKIVSQALASNRITPAEQGAAKQILASDGGVALFDTVYPTDRKAVPLGEVGTTAAPASEDSQNLSGSDAEYKAIQLLDANPDKWKSVSAVLADNPDLRAAIERDFGV